MSSFAFVTIFLVKDTTVCLNLSSTVGPFFPGHVFLRKTVFFNDVTMTSSLRSVVQVLVGHFTIFSHTDCQDDLCQKL